MKIMVPKNEGSWGFEFFFGVVMLLVLGIFAAVLALMIFIFFHPAVVGSYFGAIVSGFRSTAGI